jgi:hypothetical protein
LFEKSDCVLLTKQITSKVAQEKMKVNKRKKVLGSSWCLFYFKFSAGVLAFNEVLVKGQQIQPQLVLGV